MNEAARTETHTPVRPAGGRLVSACTLAGLVLFAIAVHLSGTTSSQLVEAPADGSRVGDVAMFAEVVENIRDDAPYYQAMGTAMRAGGYPTASVFNWRQPTLYLLLAALPVLLSAVVMAALCLLALGAIGSYLARHGSPEGTVIGVLASATAAVSLVSSQGFWMTEAWSGLLIGLSLGCYVWGRWTPGAGFGLAALFVRELAAPYCVVCVLLAGRAGRRNELRIWLGGFALFGAYYLFHAASVMSHAEAGDAAHPMSWVQFGGLPFWLATIKTNGALLAAPRWALTAASVLIVSALWSSTMPLHVRWSLLGYTSFFLVVGQPFNDYWGLMSAFVYALALAFGPDGLVSLVTRSFRGSSIRPPIEL